MTDASQPGARDADGDERYPAEFEVYDEDGESPTGSCDVCGTDTYGDEKLCDECDRIAPLSEGARP